MLSARRIATISLLLVVACIQNATADKTKPPISQRFTSKSVEEVPDFQQHVVPLLGRLGCNGRACHGSFQGRGDFRLSLFGYDFKADHEALMVEQDELRVDVDNPLDSLILQKPTDEFNHEGGLRYDKGSWQYFVLRRWIEAGAPFDAKQIQSLTRLDVTPKEILFRDKGEDIQLKAVAVWPDGTREDVTQLCRFRTNDEQVAKINQDGLVSSYEPGDTHVVVFYDNAVQPIPVIRPVTDLVANKYPKVPTPTKVDALVVDKLRKLGVVPSELSTDAAFLRRVRLDLTGSLPTPGEVETFLSDKDSNKRAKKIDELLETPAYAAWWTTKLCDFTGNNEQQLNNATPMRGSASREWYEWIYKRVSENTPYDDLVAGFVTAKSRSDDQSYLEFCESMSDIYRDDSGSEFADLQCMTHYWARRDFREPEARAIGFAYSFMGQRIQCAQCHKHPFDQWTKDDFHQFKNLFSRVVAGRQGASPEAKREYEKLVDELGLKGKRGGDLRRMLPDLLKKGETIPFPEVYLTNKPRKSRNNNGEYPVFEHAKLLGGDIVEIDGEADPRGALMQWLRQKDNPYFAHAFVNRVWASYFNVGIVEPPDSLSLANPPSNKALLDYLAKGFIENGFDMKWVHRTIANSRTYQLSWKPNETNRRDLKNFSRAVPRRLPAEVAYDAIQQATASDEKIAAMHKDSKGRAIAIPSASYRNNRGTAGYALSVFGRSTRDSNCDCDRSMEPSLLQTVFLQNDRDMLQLIGSRKDGWLDEVDRRLNPTSAKRNSEAGKVAALRKQISQIQAKLKRQRESDEKDKGGKLAKRVNELRRELVALQKPKVIEKKAVPEPQIDAIVQQAYLRTLSRYPSDQELARSKAYLQDAEDAVDGTRDLMWVLLNTKEFIVNH